MTFTIRTRGVPSQPKVAEYLCPVHGRFEMLTADPPDEAPCPAIVEEQRAHCYWTDDDGTPHCYYEDARCEESSPWVISAPKQKVLSVPCAAVTRGGDTERRPGMLDTRQLAEGMSMREWRKVQDAGRQERRHQQMIAKGLKTRRVQVG